jgi:hypothetical protein
MGIFRDWPGFVPTDDRMPGVKNASRSPKRAEAERAIDGAIAGRQPTDRREPNNGRGESDQHGGN